MRGMSCLLTGIELFPGNVMGGGGTPAGWPKGISIDQEISKHLQSQEHTRTRFGSLHFGVGVKDSADPWTRMSYDGPNQPVTPLSDPYETHRKLYGNIQQRKQVHSILDGLREDFKKVANQLPESDRKLLIDHAHLVDRMDRNFASDSYRSALVSPPPDLPEGLLIKTITFLNWEDCKSIYWSTLLLMILPGLPPYSTPSQSGRQK